MEKVIEAVNARIVGWAKYHAEGDNTGLFRTLDKWVRNRVRAYVRRRWRDRGRWKVYTAEELDGKGLARMERMISRTHQLKLFESPC